MPNASSKTKIELTSGEQSIKISMNSKRIAFAAIICLTLVGIIFVGLGHPPGTAKLASDLSGPIGASSIPKAYAEGAMSSSKIRPQSSTRRLEQTANGSSNQNIVEIHKTAGFDSQPTEMIQKAKGNKNTNSVVIE